MNHTFPSYPIPQWDFNARKVVWTLLSRLSTYYDLKFEVIFSFRLSKGSLIPLRDLRTRKEKASHIKSLVNPNFESVFECLLTFLYVYVFNTFEFLKET